MRASIIVPCYNEEETIATTVEKLKGINIDCEKEILVVDDGSTDNSANIVEKIKGVKLVRHNKNMGKGSAVKTGVKLATGDVIVIQDADLEYLPEEIPRLIKPLFEKKADVVYGSRFLGSHKGMSASHFLGNKILSIVTRILYKADVTDVMTGQKAFLKETLDNVELKAKGFEFEPEVTAKILKEHYRIIEVPITYEYRKSGKAKISWKDGCISLWWLLKNRFRLSRMNSVSPCRKSKVRARCV